MGVSAQEETDHPTDVLRDRRADLIDIEAHLDPEDLEADPKPHQHLGGLARIINFETSIGTASGKKIRKLIASRARSGVEEDAGEFWPFSDLCHQLRLELDELVAGQKRHQLKTKFDQQVVKGSVAGQLPPQIQPADVCLHRGVEQDGLRWKAAIQAEPGDAGRSRDGDHARPVETAVEKLGPCDFQNRRLVKSLLGPATAALWRIVAHRLHRKYRYKVYIFDRESSASLDA